MDYHRLGLIALVGLGGCQTTKSYIHHGFHSHPYGTLCEMFVDRRATGEEITYHDFYRRRPADGNVDMIVQETPAGTRRTHIFDSSTPYRLVILEDDAIVMREGAQTFQQSFEGVKKAFKEQERK